MIPGYKKDANITIMNTYYTRPQKIDEKTWSKDSITLIYKDNETGKKHHYTIEEPSHEYYRIKEDKVKRVKGIGKDGKVEENSYQPFFVPIEDCELIKVPHRYIDREIAKQTKNEEFYKTNIRNRDFYSNRALHMEPNIMFSDTDIQDHYRFLFSREYTNEITKLRKGYFDIEVDGKYQKGDFPEMGECPINCCSYLDESTETVYTFILRNHKNPLIEEFEKSVDDSLYKELKDFVREKVGGWKQEKRFKLDNFQYKIFFFDNEIEMILSMFQLFHKIDPDFILVWNMVFDMNYIIARIEELGYNPTDIMCNKSFEKPVSYYYTDSKNMNEPAERTDFCDIAGNITWLCQMIQFCSRRKANLLAFKDFKLDTIGEDIAKVKKLDYHHITDSIIKLPYVDFKTFVFYNVMDVVVQKCIETKTQDLEYIFAKCIINNTSYRKGHRQTVYLINRIASEFYKNGLIIGNNCNVFNEKPSTKFEGARVVDPLTTNDFSKMHLFNRGVMLADNMLDEDYKALYPSITIEHNVAPNTIIGKIEIEDKIYENENYYQNDRYSRSGDFIEAYTSHDILEFMTRWFRFANIKEFLLEDIIEYFNQYHIEIYKNQVQAVHFYNEESRTALRFGYKPTGVYFFEPHEELDKSISEYREELRRKVGL